MKRLCFIWIVIIFVNYQAVCQDKKVVDSLLHQLEIMVDDTSKVKVYLDLWGLFHRSDPSKAIEFAKSANQLSEKINYTKGLAITNYRLGNRLVDFGDFVQAEKLLGLAVENSKAINDSILLAHSYSGLANLYLEKNDYEQAISNYLISIDIFEEKRDLNSVARISNKIGTLFYRQQQYHKALAHYERALSIVRKLNSLPGISACLTNIGMLYETLKEYDKALTYLEEALPIKVKTGDKLGESRVLQNISNIYQELKQYGLSNDYYTKALKLGEEVGSPQQIMNNLYNLGTNEFFAGNNRQSILYAMDALQNIPGQTNLGLSIKLHDLLSHANVALGNFEQGYKHAQSTIALQDSLYNEQRLQLSNDLEAKYQNEKKEREIATLQATSEIDKLKLQENKKEQQYLTGFALLILLLGLVLWSRYRIKVKSNNKLLELDQLKSHFFANISHEFRTPLTIITGILRERLFNQNEENVQDVATMYRSAQRLQNLIDQLLDLSKIDAKSMKLTVREGEVYEYLRTIGSSFSSFAFQLNIHYQTNIPNHQLFGFFDHDKLEKIVSNLLSNAFKFTLEKGSVVFSASDKNGHLHLMVEDTGVGMAEEELTKVFDRFYQIDNGHTRSQEGAGIGLALTKELTELHHGQISVESTAGSGSIFKVSLPLKKEHYQLTEISSDGAATTYRQPFVTSPKEQNIHTVTKRTGELPILLIVEDNDDLRCFIAGRLDGYRILEAANGTEGLKKANSYIPDLIITDVMMPNMDGMAFVEHLKNGEATGHIPVIMLTAKADMPSKIEGLETGADNYLTKPFEMHELQVRIKNLIGQRQKLRNVSAVRSS